MAKTTIEMLDEKIELETDPAKLALLRRERERTLQAQADAPTGENTEDLLWYRRYRTPNARHARVSR